MKSSPFPISRRTMLRGVGATLALPWLEAMMPSRLFAAPEASRPPVRMAVLYMANGVNPDTWTPEGQGRDFRFTPTLEPLADLKDDVLVLTNLWNKGSVASEGHYVKTSGFLTCTTITKTLGVDLSCNGISMDQAAAQRAGRQTPLPSLELALESVSTGVDNNVGYTRVYGSHISWAGPTRPLARDLNPNVVYERLFRASRQQPDASGQDPWLLDRVLADAKRLRARLGVADRQRMDEYLQGARSLEERLERSAGGNQSEWRPRVPIEESARPGERNPGKGPGNEDSPAGRTENQGALSNPGSHTDNTRWMLDMMALAMQSDTTRILTFMFGNAVSNRNFSFLEGVRGSHHGISHHQKNPEKLRMYQRINQWHVEQYAYLLRKLRGMKEGDGTVLDNCMILLGAGLRDGDRHDPHNLPIVLGGRGGGRLATGQHLVYGKDSPLSNLYVTMLDLFGTPVERFADSTGPLSGVLA
jgi:hypothetical protein